MTVITGIGSPYPVSQPPPFHPDDILAKAWDEGLAPDPELTVTEWADRYRILSSRAAAESGQYRSTRTPYLREIMDNLSALSDVRRVVFMKAAQIGAPLALDTPVATTKGWATMGTLRIGDQVFDEDGFPCNVTGLSAVFVDRDCWRISFDDGASIISDSEHRWSVISYKGNRRTLTTARLARQPVKVRAPDGRRQRYRWAIDCCKPLDLPTVALPIPPYSLGVWLGDGSAWVNQITIATADAMEVAAGMRLEGVNAIVRAPAWCPETAANIILDPLERTGFCLRGHDLAVTGLTTAGACKVCDRQRSNAQHGPHRRQPDPVLPRPLRFGELMRRHGLLAAKHIPPVYLRASAAQRHALLQGLMDTDGYVDADGGRCEFSTVDDALADGVAELLHSLGIKFNRTAHTTGTLGRKAGSQRPLWRFSFTAYADLPPFRLIRKRERLQPADRPGLRPTRTRRRRIVSIDRVASVPVRCIEVDAPSHLFLAGTGMVPTHNSEAGMNWIGYIMDQVPGPVMLVQPTVDTAKRFSNQRIQPLIDDCPQLAEKVARSRSRDTANTMLMKEFLGGVLIITGANSAVGLRSMPVRFLMCDEVDAYPGDLEDEGDPLALAEARTRTFGIRCKVFLASTPKLKGTSRISREFDLTDKRFYFVPCPHCNEPQVLTFNRLKWEPGRPETVTYQCVKCDVPIRESAKTEMLARGAWRPTAETHDRTVRGYHLSALYSPSGWLSWAEIAKQWEEATGDVERRKTFINTVLGECWEEEADTVPDWTRLYERREDWPHLTVPGKGLFLTAGADVQADRIELDVWAWGRGLEFWLVEHLVVWGDPGKPETFRQVDEVLGRTWEHANGQRLVLQRLAIDSGAFTQQVYAWVRTQNRAAVLAVKGVPQYDRTVPVSGPTFVEVAQNGIKVKRGVGVWTVSVSFFKRELYKLLALPRPTDQVIAETGYPAGYVHFPFLVGDEWCQQLVSEQMVIVRSRRGWAVRTEWRQLRPRNEALDMRVYARAAVWLAGADRWPESYWTDLERQLGIRDPDDGTTPAPQPPPIQPVPQPGALAQPTQQFRRPVMVRSLGRRW